MPAFRSSHQVIGFSVFTVVVVWALFAFGLWGQRSDTIALVDVSNERLVQVLEAHLQRSIEMVNLVLNQTEHIALVETASMAALDPRGSRLLSEAISQAPFIAGLAIVGVNGIADQGIEVLADGIPRTMNKRFDANNRDYFTVFKASPKRKLFVGAPIKTKTTGRWVVPISRAVLDGQGHFKGVNVAIVRLETFSEIFDEVRPENTQLTVYLDDGNVFIKSPYDPGQKLEANVDIIQKTMAAKKRPAGVIAESGAETENVNRISYRFALKWPLVIVLETPLKSVLANWRGDVKREALIGLFATALFSGLAALLIAQLSRREQVEAELNKRSSAVEFSPVIVMITNTKGIIEYVNPHFVEVSGYTETDVIGHTPAKVSSGKTPPETYLDMWDTISSGNVWFGEFHNRRKNGGDYWVSASIAPIKSDDGKITHYVGVEEDISERKRLEVALVEAKEDAVRVNKAKSDLMANMSHELRTPLNAIIGFSDTMRSEVFGPIGNDKYHDYLQDIHHSGEHLLELINDILDVSAIEQGALELHEENVVLIDLVNTSVRLIRPRADIGKVNVDVTVSRDDELPALYVDARRVKQVLLNLLSNAVKFTPERGTVTVQSWLKDDGGLAICVGDTGIGMNSKEVEVAMSSFGQVDSGLDRKHEGTGLGLPLTKGLMELHGGALHIQSSKGQGTRITATFPKTRVVQDFS